MNILVTGGAGNVGRGVVSHLIQNGHTVRVVDWRIEERNAGAEYAVCDITNFTDLREQVRGQEAIIHLAAFPYPGAASGPEIFRVNCTGTYNIFEAAAAEGIKRVACASSINALGYNFGVKSFPIQYFPMDEEHPTFTTDPYSFSKQTTEAIAAYYWRRDGISSTCLRMPFIYTMSEEFSRWGKSFTEGYQRLFNDFMAKPEQERTQSAAKMLAQFNERRSQRLSEKPFDANESWEPDLNDPALLLFFGYTDFWAILSVEDAAQAFEKSLLAEFEGSYPLYLSEDQNSSEIESEALLHTFYPEVTTRQSPIRGSSTIVSFEKARKLIGFDPAYRVWVRLASGQ